MTEQSGQLMSIGAVAGANIAQSLGKPELAGEITAAIKDEINAMATHFTLAFTDISNEHEIALAKLKDEYESRRVRLREDFYFVRANWQEFAGSAVFFVGLGALLGLLVR